MVAPDVEYKFVQPGDALCDYVESYWMLVNHANEPREIVLVPDGRIDVIFSCSANEPFHTLLMGLSDQPDQTIFAPGTIMAAVSFKLSAVEYILRNNMAGLLNEAQLLPNNFWGIEQADLHDFDHFYKKVSLAVEACIKEPIDGRKQKLFNLIYASNGAMSVKELSEQSYWSSRQINRYFNQQFGISLKTYCNILRFRASFEHIKEGKLFPQQNFADQAHFIKEVKKFAGVVPKALSKNKNDRFIQFSTLPKK